MKNGTYKVTFEVELANCLDEDEAKEAIGVWMNETLDNNEFPEVVLELVEEEDLEYETEDEIQELNF